MAQPHHCHVCREILKNNEGLLCESCLNELGISPATASKVGLVPPGHAARGSNQQRSPGEEGQG